MTAKRKPRVRGTAAPAAPEPPVPAQARNDDEPAADSKTRSIDVGGDLAQVLTMFVGRCECAVPVLRVREIASYASVTPVPMTPVWIHGVMNLRGTVVPVIDLAAKLGMEPARVTRRTCLIIIETRVGGELLLMAVVVDSVSRVIDLAGSELMDPPPFGAEVAVEFIRGILEIEGRLVMLLDIESVLSAGDVATIGSIPTSLPATDAREAEPAAHGL